MEINITLIVGIILLIIGVRVGYKIGLAKGIANLIALVATVFTLALIIMFTSSFKAGETRNTIYTLIIMAILGAVYSVVRFLLKSFKAISNLPIIKFFDSLLGIIVGIAWVTVLYVCILNLGLKGYLGSASEIITKDVNSNLFLTLLCKYNIFL